MKKLIAISVVFALVAGVAFAMDVGGTVIGTVNVLQGSTAEGDDDITSSGGLSRIRIDGGGEANENFGGYFRADDGAFYGNAWWKPIDQFKLLIGSNGWDGFIGKEGNTGWMFHQTATDTGVTYKGAGVWDPDIYGYDVSYRSAFFEGGGDGGNAAYLFITPAEIASINVILPFFSGGETAEVFKHAVFQVDLNLDFGNIALTYKGGAGTADASNIPEMPTDFTAPDYAEKLAEWAEKMATWKPDMDTQQIFAYFGGSFGDLSLDVGLGYTLPISDSGIEYASPIAIGFGVKYATDSFGVKFRTVVNLAGDDETTKVLADVLPYFTLSDNLTAFVNVGLGLRMNDADTLVGWHINPYLQVGEEWGAKFLAGIKASSAGGDDAVIKWAIPIALIVSF